MVTGVASIITIAQVAVGFFHGTARGWPVNGWVGPIAVIVGTGAILATVFLWRRRSRAWPSFAWFVASSSLLALHFVVSGVTWQEGTGRWAIYDIPILLGAVLLASPSARRVMANRSLKFCHKLVAAAVATGVALVLLAVSAVAAGVVRGAFVAPPPPIHKGSPGSRQSRPGRGVSPVVNPPPGPTVPVVVFPIADSTCVGWFSSTTPRPDGIDQDLWNEVLIVASSYARWNLCLVGDVKRGADGLIDVKVFSATSGPEGHIQVERDIDGQILGRFVKPQAGQLYYQQPDGNPLISWGFPDIDVACGNGGRLVIFRRPDHTIEAFSRWSAPISETTSGTLAAYYTPARIAVPLLTDLERRGLPLLPARGPITLFPTGETSQNFAGQMTVRSVDPSIGSLTTSRLLARCADTP